MSCCRREVTGSLAERMGPGVAQRGLSGARGGIARDDDPPRCAKLSDGLSVWLPWWVLLLSFFLRAGSGCRWLPGAELLVFRCDASPHAFGEMVGQTFFFVRSLPVNPPCFFVSFVLIAFQPPWAPAVVERCQRQERRPDSWPDHLRRALPDLGVHSQSVRSSCSLRLGTGANQ